MRTWAVASLPTRLVAKKRAITCSSRLTGAGARSQSLNEGCASTTKSSATSPCVLTKTVAAQRSSRPSAHERPASVRSPAQRLHAEKQLRQSQQQRITNHKPVDESRVWSLESGVKAKAIAAFPLTPDSRFQTPDSLL